MTQGWNFERRRDTCTQFLIGVWALTQGMPEKDTSLEAVRSRMKLSPEEARFAARRLSEEALIAFDEAGGPVRSNVRGTERAREQMNAVRAKMLRGDDMARTLRTGGPPLAVVAAVLRVDGEPLACGGPDPDAAYRLRLVAEVVTLEQRGAGGDFEPARDA